jgi:hypothetical protein
VQFIVSHEAVCRIVERLIGVGRLTGPKLDEDSGLWTASVSDSSGRHIAHGVDALHCLANLHKKALPGVAVWR